MLIWTTRFTRKKAVLAVVALGLVFAAAILLAGKEGAPKDPAAEALLTNEDRVAYLQSLGWEVEPEPVETLQFLLPESLEEPYVTYNQLQLEQGFDLSACCGKQVSRFTYHVTNYPDHPNGVQLNLYVCENLPVAGDICSPGAGGFQAGLRFPETET